MLTHLKIEQYNNLIKMKESLLSIDKNGTISMLLINGQ
jgi:hypothetical protein